MGSGARRGEAGDGGDRSRVLFVDHGEVGRRIREAIRRADAVPVEATDGTDAIKRVDVESVDLVVVPASLPDVRIDTLLGRLSDRSDVDPCIVVGDDERLAGPMIQVSADVTVDDLADRIVRAIRDRRFTDELRKHDQLKTAILRVAGALDRESSEAVLRVAFDELRDIGGYRFVWIGRYEPEDDSLTFLEPLNRHVPVDAVVGELGTSNAALLRRAIERRTVTQTSEPDAARAVSTPAGGEETGEDLVVTSVPLVDGDRTVGVLVVSTAPANTPDRSERELLSHLGHVCGLVLGRGAEEHHGDTGRIERLVRSTAFELRDLLQVASLSIESARDGEGSALDRAEEALATMSEVIDATVAIGTTEEVEFEPVDVYELVVSTWRDIRTSDAELTIVEPVTVEADPTLLERLLWTLLRNAVERGGSNASVRVGGLRGGRGFYVADDGPRIHDEDRDTPFDRGASSRPEGLGGLGFVREIADAHGWDVSVREGKEGGTRFEVVTERNGWQSPDYLEALFSEDAGEFVFPADSSQ